MAYTLRSLLDGPAFHIFSLVRDGVCEMEHFLSEIERKDEASASSLLTLLERSSIHGPPLNKEKSRDVGGEIFEFKAKQIRVCYFYDANRMIICTHGFHKPTKKVQNNEIKAAKKLRQKYFEEKSNGLVKIEKPT